MPAAGSGKKENAPNQIGKVMNKPGQGGSELHVQGKWAHLILQWPDFADYLRKNPRVKDYRPTATARHAGPPAQSTAKADPLRVGKICGL